MTLGSPSQKEQKNKATVFNTQAARLTPWVCEDYLLTTRTVVSTEQLLIRSGDYPEE